METKIFHDDFVLDISRQKVQFQENNSRFSDKSFSKFTLPFEIDATDEFLRSIGDYVTLESRSLGVKIPVYLFHENKTSEAEFNISQSKGNRITGQINFGLDDVPNFDRKLSELPLAKFAVPDIHIYAKDVCAKNYPQTDFNFPRMYTTKYDPTNELWDAFDGYYNDLKADGTEMRRNYVDGNLDIYNVNIIHPCPYVLYILKTGFGDKGYELAGDILTDPDLVQRCVFSGTEYFTTLAQRRSQLTVSPMDYDVPQTIASGAMYIKDLVIPKSGKYKVRGYFRLNNIKSDKLANISLNGLELWAVGSTIYGQHNVYFDFDIDVTTNNSTLKFYLRRYNAPTDMDTVISAELIGKELDLTEDNTAEETGVVTNLNQVDLTRAVPEMTFGEFVNTIKNWFNYDIALSGKTITMNKLNKDPENVKDFSKFQQNHPTRKFSAKKSFLIKFQDLDGEQKKNSMYYDHLGYKLNGEPQTDTSTIEINGYAMPVELIKPGGYQTVVVKKDSANTVALVYYDGLQMGQNNATNPPGCDFPELWPKNWEKFLRQRVNSGDYEDEFYAHVSDISQYTIKDYILWHNTIHQIKSWTKEMVTPDIYRVVIQTESIV